jgi:DNA adenine methylase
MKSPVRWAGSKLQTVAILKAYARSIAGKYVEAFAGSACLFFEIEPRKAVLGDLNPDLMRAYRSLRDDSEAVISALVKISPDEETYYRVRAQDPEEMATSEAAARFFYLNRFCFNGLYRTNRAGKFNVPYGHRKKNESINFSALRQAANVLRAATLINDDFERCLESARCGDFVYLDPPYATSSGTRLFAEYLPDSFAVTDLNRLNDTLIHLNKRGAKFVVSYADVRLAHKAFEQWRISRVSVRRNIAGFVGHRRHAGEIFATNMKELTV